MASKDKEIKVFRPTWDQFKDFLGYIEYIEQSGGHEAGAVKVSLCLEPRVKLNRTFLNIIKICQWISSTTIYTR